MDWKLPDFVQEAWDKVKPREVPTESSAAQEVADDEDDLGVRFVQHKGTVPFRRVESAVHTFVQVAVPADLDRLYRHQNNIKKWRQKDESEKLRAEYMNSARTVQQLTRNLREMELLRAKVIVDDLPEFDNRLKPAKEKAMNSICEFLAIHGEQIDHDDGAGQCNRTNVHAASTNDGDNQTNDNEQPLLNTSEDTSHTVCGDSSNEEKQSNEPTNCENVAASSSRQNIEVVQFRGNRFVIESAQGSDPEIEQVEETDPLTEQMQSHESQHEAETEEFWEKLRKDLLELHGVIYGFSSLVHDQGKVVDDITSNIEKAEEHIKEGNIQLKKATILKAAMFPVLGAVVGGIIGGPIGFAAGLKLGSVTSGLAAAGVTGTVLGYQGGKFLKNKQQEEGTEMKEIKHKKEKEDDSSSQTI